MKPDSRTLSARLARAFSRASAAVLHRDRRVAFIRELFFRIARRFTGVISVESGGLRYLVNTDDHGVGMTLFMGDGIEQDTLDRALRILESHGLAGPAGRTLIDVGAHVGTTSVAALGSHGVERAVCFEPSPRNRELLELNLRYNGLEDRATVVPVALSDRDGTAEFEVAPMNPSDGRVRVSGADDVENAYGEGGWQAIEVPTTTLDSYVESGAVDPDSVGLVWIDAQGHEGHVLAGARRLLDRNIPVLIEFWPYGLRRAGGLEWLLELISESFRLVVDLGGASAEPRPASDTAPLAEEYWGVAHTDLLLIP